MPKGSLNVSLKGADDIFSTEESRQEQQREQVQQIPIGELFPFKNHPFKVLDDESMQRTVESVEQYGVLSPLIARPRPEGGYEIISGHRRQHAAQLAGLDTLPVIVRNMDDDAAVLLMADSNLQRENILPSERAFAYKMKLETLKNQGARSDLTSRQVGEKLWSVSQVSADANESERQVHRFIRLTNLMQKKLPYYGGTYEACNIPFTDFQICYQPEQIRIVDSKRILEDTAFLCRKDNDHLLILPSVYEKLDLDDWLLAHLFFYDKDGKRCIGVELSEVD